MKNEIIRIFETISQANLADYGIWKHYLNALSEIDIESLSTLDHKQLNSTLQFTMQGVNEAKQQSEILF